MSKREEKVPPRYVGKKECARPAEKAREKEENCKRKGLKLKK